MFESLVKNKNSVNDNNMMIIIYIMTHIENNNALHNDINMNNTYILTICISVIKRIRLQKV